MKKLWLLTPFLGLSLLNSCSKDKDDTNTPPPPEVTYMDLTANASRTYGQTDIAAGTPETTFILTTTNQDTTSGGKTFRIFHNSANGINQYFNITPASGGNDYYNMINFRDLGVPFDLDPIVQLYLKDYASVNTSWQAGSSSSTVDVMGFNVTVNFNLENKIVAKGLNRTVNNVAYNDVTQVSTTISANFINPLTGVPTPIDINSNIQSYYAPKVGLIENTSDIDISIDLIGMQESAQSQTRLLNSNFP